MIIFENRPFNGVYYGEDVEKEATEYLQKLKDYNGGEYYHFRETKKREKVSFPQSWNIPLQVNGKMSVELSALPKAERKQCIDFWTEQQRKIEEGDDGMSPIMYGYYNFGRLFGGKGEIQYRRHDNEYYWLIDACINGDNEHFQGYHKWGINEIGRRRSGKSSKFGGAIHHWLKTMREITVIVTSKTEDDAKKILNEKVSFMYQNFPVPLKPTMLSSSMDHLKLGVSTKDSAGNRMVSGRNTVVYAISPKPESAEGNTLFALVIDEQGKIKDLKKFLDLTLPALNDAEGFDREGFVLLTGVSGDMSKFPDAAEIWAESKSYKLVRWFSPGWCGLCCDEFGNEDVEMAVRKILQWRNDVVTNKSLSPGQKEKKLHTIMQQYPLTIQESFLSSDGQGKFNYKNIQAQMDNLREDPVELFGYDIEWKHDKLVPLMTPATVGGKLLVLEPPIKGARYVAGGDAYGMKQTDTGSDGALWIWKLENTRLSEREREHIMSKLARAKTMEEKKECHLKLGDLPVALYVDRMPDPKIFADRSAAILKWYHYNSHQDQPCRVGIDRQPSNIIDYLLENFLDYVMPSPIQGNKKPSAKDFSEYGITQAGGYWAEKRYEEIGGYTTHSCDKLYFPISLSNMLTYDETNQKRKHDDIDALGNALITARDFRVLEWNEYKKKEEEAKPGLEFFAFTRSE